MSDDKKELAEKVAGMLGYNPEVNNSIKEWYYDEFSWEMDFDTDAEIILSWPTVGLCLKKARELGWLLDIKSNSFDSWISFHVMFSNKDKRFWGQQGLRTPFRLSKHGYIEAIINAFSEIPIVISKPQTIIPDKGE